MASCNIDCSPQGIFFLIFQIIHAGLLITIMLFSSKIYDGGDVSSAIASELIANFESVPITDFAQMDSIYNDIDSLRNLKESLGLNPVNFGSWRGTLKGCGKINKDESTSVRLLERDKQCNSDEEVLNEIPSKYLRSYYGIKLSMSTIGNSYYQLLNQEGSIVSENEDCQNGKKSCGYIDTLKNKLCININDICPLNYIKVDINKPTDVYITKTFLGNGRNIYISNNPYSDEKKNPHIIAAFKIANEKICSIPSLYWSEYPLYPLDASIKSYSDNCILKDQKQNYAYENGDRFHKIDVIKMYDLFNENGIIDTIKNSKLTKYGFDFDKEYGEKEIYLYVRRFYGFNKKCLDERTKKFNIDQLEDLEKNHTTSDRMKTWSTVVKVLLGISGFATIINLFDFQDEPFKVDVFIKNIAALLLSIANLAYTCIANKFDDPFQDEFKCSDHITNEIYNIMIKNIKNSGFYIKLTNYFIIGYLVVIVILFIIHLVIECKKN